MPITENNRIIIDFDNVVGTKGLARDHIGYYRPLLDTTHYIFRNDTLLLRNNRGDTVFMVKKPRA
mgnify:CR=1 FL=1